MVSCLNKNIFIPTGFDNKLFCINENFKISKKNVDEGASYINFKNNDKLMLFNLPYGNINRVSFSSNNKRKYVDISNSLLLCGDFNDQFIYILGPKFNTELGELFLFIIDKNNLKIVEEKKLPVHMKVTDVKLIDNKLFIGVDEKVDYLIYYDTIKKCLTKIKYNDLVLNRTFTSKILYNKKSIIFISLDGEIIKLDRKSLKICDFTSLKGEYIISGDIKDNKLYLLSELKNDVSIAKISIIDLNNLKKIKDFKIGPIRDTLPRDIFIYR